MEGDILNKVLEAEKAIAERVKAEEEKISLWLAEQKRVIKREKEAEVGKLEESSLADVDEARKTAEQKIAAMVEDAAELDRLLSTLGDKLLARIVRTHIDRIRPGKI